MKCLNYFFSPPPPPKKKKKTNNNNKMKDLFKILSILHEVWVAEMIILRAICDALNQQVKKLILKFDCHFAPKERSSVDWFSWLSAGCRDFSPSNSCLVINQASIIIVWRFTFVYLFTLFLSEANCGIHVVKKKPFR